MRTESVANLSFLQSPDRRVFYLGHGQMESSPENFSTLHVLSHELGHSAEFRSEASRSGAEIRSLDISIQYEIRNGKLVAVSGETRMTSIEKNDQPSDKNFLLYGPGKEGTLSLVDPNQPSKINPKNTKARNPLEDSQLSDEDSIKSLEKRSEEARRTRLEEKLKTLEEQLGKDRWQTPSAVSLSVPESAQKFTTNPNQNPNDPDSKLFPHKDKSQVDYDPFAKKDEQKQRLEEIEREKKRIENELLLMRLQEEMKRTFDMLVEMRTKQDSDTLGLAGWSDSLHIGDLLDISA